MLLATPDGVRERALSGTSGRNLDATNMKSTPGGDLRVAVWSAPSHWETLIARDAAGAELETYRRR